MKFTALKTKVVRLGDRKFATFKNGIYETADKTEIAVLEKAKGVKKVASKSNS